MLDCNVSTKVENKVSLSGLVNRSLQDRKMVFVGVKKKKKKSSSGAGFLIFIPTRIEIYLLFNHKFILFAVFLTFPLVRLTAVFIAEMLLRSVTWRYK